MQRFNQMLMASNYFDENQHLDGEMDYLNDNEISFEHENENNQFTTNESILINKVNEM